MRNTRTKRATNPLKILISLISIGAMALSGSGALRPAPEAGRTWQLYFWTAFFIATAIWSLFRTWKNRPRKKWAQHQILVFSALAVLAGQSWGGYSTTAAGIYVFLSLWTAYRGRWPWSLAAPLSAILVELLSAHYTGSLVIADGRLLMMIIVIFLGFGAAKLWERCQPAAGAHLRLEYDEPEEDRGSLEGDLQSLCELAHASLGARTVAIFLAEDQDGLLKLKCFKSHSPAVDREAWLEVGKSFLGWAVRERQGLLYSDYQREVRDLGYYRNHEKVASVLAMPFGDEKRILGLLVADSDVRGALGEESKLLAAGFAQQAARLVSLNLKHTALGLEHERLREWNRRLEMMASRLRVSEVMDIMKDLVPQLTGCDHLVLLEVLPEVGQARVRLSYPATPAGPAPQAVIDITGTIAEQALKLREWRLVDDFYRRSLALARYTAEESRDHGFRSVLIAPLMIDEECRFLLGMESRRPNAFEPSLDTIHIIANQFSLALRSAAMYEEKEALARHDGLTGLWNHRHFQETLAQLLGSGRRDALSLLLLDIDHFKKLNDTYGHQTGDVVLKEVAARIKKAVSQYDLAARYGGEEFVIVWPGSDLTQSERLAQELRQEITGRPFATSAGQLPVTVSLGLASYPIDAQDKDSLIKAADQALYAAKRGGRDRLVCYRHLANHQEKTEI